MCAQALTEYVRERERAARESGRKKESDLHILGIPTISSQIKLYSQKEKRTREREQERERARKKETK